MDVKRNICDIFALLKKFLRVDWQPKHIIIGLFKRRETTWQLLARNLITLLDEYGFEKKFVVYVNDERAKLNAIIVALKCMVSCEILSLDESF
jgi:hypothetical protein